jgi:hypothetical protein
MQYLVNVLDGGPRSGQQTTGTATDVEAAAVDAFNDRLRAAGQWVFAAGLSGPADATVVDDRDGVGLVEPGPRTDAPEHVAGFWIWDLPDGETALRLARDASRACNRRVEVRPVL